MNKHRKLWEAHYGEIPKDEHGRSYEIHHLDGNHNNNNIDNLVCVTIQEHYNIHYRNGDWGACVLIAKRMNLPANYISIIQKGKKRPGIGGVKEGAVPWNLGKFGYKLNLTESGKQNKITAVKNRAIIKDSDSENILCDYNNRIKIDDPKIGLISKNGLPYSYDTAFVNYYGKIYGVSSAYIRRIIRRSDSYPCSEKTKNI
jgi:hypothetical protein